MSAIQLVLAASSSAALAVSTSGDANDFALGPGFHSISTNSVFATATGGSGGYSYSWTYVSGDNVFTASSPSASSTNWTGTDPTGYNVYSALWKVTVTDSALHTAAAYCYVNYTGYGV